MKTFPALSIPILKLKSKAPKPFALPLTVACVLVPAISKAVSPVRFSEIVNDLEKAKLNTIFVLLPNLIVLMISLVINCPSIATVKVPIFSIDLDNCSTIIFKSKFGVSVKVANVLLTRALTSFRNTIALALSNLFGKGEMF